MPEYEIVGYRPEFLEPLVVLFSEAFRLAPQDCRNYLDWKYGRNPYLRESLLFVARDGRGSILGMRGFYGTCWQVAGRRMVIPCADDFAIAAGERNKGLMTLIMRAALEALARRGFGYTMNASGGQLTVLQSLAMGWKSLGAMEPVVRLSRLERARCALDRVATGRRFVWRFTRDSYGYPPCSFAELDRYGRRSASRDGNLVVESSPRPEAMAELAGSMARDGRISHVRDAEFFRWRFGNPTREYRFLYYERDGTLEGFLVIAGYRQSKLPFSIVDFETRSEHSLAELLESALAWGRFPAIGAWLASLSHGARTMLTRHGFEPTDIELRARGMPCVLLKKLGPADVRDSAIEGAAWNIRLIDSMRG